MTDILTIVALNLASTFLFHIILTLKQTMSKDKKTKETVAPAATTTTETPETETPATVPPQADAPATEKSTAKTKEAKTDFVCPVCNHTVSVKIGTPYQNGENTCQLVKCVKCNHVMVDVLS